MRSNRRPAVLAAAAMLMLACVLAPVLAPAPARADGSQLSVMMDDDQLLYRGDRARDRALGAMQSLGVDAVRVTLLWRVVGGAVRVGRDGRPPATFDPRNPHDYPYAVWDRYDRLVAAAAHFHIGVYLDVTGPGPPWAMGRTPDRRLARSFMPDPRAFYKFVLAVGRRYSGRYHDEDDGNLVLPRVGAWSLWNEPNQPGWLSPQWARDDRGQIMAYSPVLYRELYLWGHRALAETSHGRDQIFAGETAPLGSNKRFPSTPMRPRQFIDELFCVAPDGRSYVGHAATVRRCSDFQRLGGFSATAWAHHPYTKNRPPEEPDPNPDSFTIANLDALTGRLDAIAAGTGLLPAGLPVLLSEFGYETNPPDPYNGLSPLRQADYLDRAEEIAYRNPRVIGLTQYLLRDAAPLPHTTGRRSWFGYQSGLLFAGGAAKPALAAYALPFDVTPLQGGQLDAWGRLRFRRRQRLAALLLGVTLDDSVLVQHRLPGATAWQTVGDPVPVSDPSGFFDVVLPDQGPGSWRVAWLGAEGDHPVISREVPAPG